MPKKYIFFGGGGGGGGCERKKNFGWGWESGQGGQGGSENKELMLKFKKMGGRGQIGGQG